VIGWPDHRDDPVPQTMMMVSFGPPAAPSDLAA
jgi:hypothetical protein